MQPDAAHALFQRLIAMATRGSNAFLSLTERAFQVVNQVFNDEAAEAS